MAYCFTAWEIKQADRWAPASALKRTPPTRLMDSASAPRPSSFKNQAMALRYTSSRIESMWSLADPAPLCKLAPLRFGIQLHCETAHEILDTGGMRRGGFHQMLGERTDESGQLPLDMQQFSGIERVGTRGGSGVKRGKRRPRRFCGQLRLEISAQ